MERYVLIAYGNGKELGDFNIFARTLKRDLEEGFDAVKIQPIQLDHELFDFIRTVQPAQARI